MKPPPTISCHCGCNRAAYSNELTTVRTQWEPEGGGIRRQGRNVYTVLKAHAAAFENELADELRLRTLVRAHAGSGFFERLRVTGRVYRLRRALEARLHPDTAARSAATAAAVFVLPKWMGRFIPVDSPE